MENSDKTLFKHFWLLKLMRTLCTGK